MGGKRYFQKNCFIHPKTIGSPGKPKICLTYGPLQGAKSKMGNFFPILIKILIFFRWGLILMSPKFYDRISNVYQLAKRIRLSNETTRPQFVGRPAILVKGGRREYDHRDLA